MNINLYNMSGQVVLETALLVSGSLFLGDLQSGAYVMNVSNATHAVNAMIYIQ